MGGLKTASLLVVVVLAGCGSSIGGPEVVEDQCVTDYASVDCDIVVENPTDSAMDVNVTVEIGSEENTVATKSEITEVEAGTQKNVSIVFAGTTADGYNVDVTAAE